MTLIRRLLLLALATPGLSAPASAVTLRFIADVNLPSATQFDATDFGGLSGLVFDVRTGRALVLSDDRSERQSARFYSVQIAVEPSRLTFEPMETFTLRRPNDTPFLKGKIDPEAIARLDSKRIFVASEGNGWLRPRVEPGVFEFTMAGKIIRKLPLSRKFLPNLARTRGTKENCSFEGLTITPNRKFLFAATECPLIQDGEAANFSHGARSRILRYALDGESRVLAGEFTYSVEPNHKPEGATKDFGNGISEMLALNDREFLILERGTAMIPTRAANRIRLYKATLGEATDVTAFSSIANRTNIIELRKELVLDFETTLPKLDARWPTIDNLEAMSFGPVLPNGHRTLLFISDNNFNPLQRTQILAFEILENAQ